MEPRIVVPETKDLAVVVTALVHYSHRIAATGALTGDFIGMIDRQKVVVELLETLRDQLHAEHAEEAIKAMTDDDIAESLEKFREEFGNGTGL